MAQIQIAFFWAGGFAAGCRHAVGRPQRADVCHVMPEKPDTEAARRGMEFCSRDRAGKKPSTAFQLCAERNRQVEAPRGCSFRRGMAVC